MWQVDNKQATLTNRIQEMEERISGVEDTIEEMDTSVKGNVKYRRILAHNIQEIWNTMKILNLSIIGREEEESLIKGQENIFNRIIEENFS